MIEIIKASAGSGKTFTLARKYIMLLLQNEDRYAYRHILAVTFTNKATEEMKSRILKELHVLSAEPRKSGYYKDFVPAYYADDESLRKAAETVLCNILHDYSAFAVSTIDRFFQQTLKAFSREIGQFASYQIELDRESLIAESVDRVLDSITGDKKDEKKLKWLTDNTISQIENGEGYKLDYTLKNVASRLKSEEHRTLVEGAGLDEDIIYSEQELKKLSDGCCRVCDDYMAALQKAAADVRTAFSAAGLAPEDTTRHFMSDWLDKYINLKDSDQIQYPSDSFMKNAQDVSKWFPKAKSYMENMVTSSVISAVEDLLSLFGKEYEVYNTALLLKAQVYGFGIANDLHHEFEALLKEKNVLSLDDSNTILKNIIDGTETPFIYEKLGVRYEHFLLDEFQDTSRVQWENFRPLLKNSIDSGFYNLIVGDVKQSIYRFRNSDWKLLRDEAPYEFGRMVKLDTLEDNWRSFGNIVRFNNSFFSAVSEVMDLKYGFEKNDEGVLEDGVLTGIYEDVRQNIQKKGDGAVKLTFCQREDELQAILDSINAALEKGYSYKDIAVLVRWNKDGAEVASYLIANKIGVVTDDSLMISSSLTVRRLVSLLSSIDNPDDSMARYLAEHLEVEIPESYSSIIDLCEDLLRKLRNYNQEVFSSEVLYVQSFMDVLRDYVEKNGNSLHAFLKDWEGNTQSISSPKVGDSVRIMTVHKSKGLDFPYVIVPFMEGVGLSRHEKKWCRPDVSGTGLEGVAEGVYDVTLSGKSEKTLFASHYRDETLLQYVDNMNVVYVALTRAKECMEVISALPEEDVCEAIESGAYDEKSAKDFSQILYWYAVSHGNELGFRQDEQTFVYGDIPEREQDIDDEGMASLSADFCSWPLDARLRFNTDSSDFFNDDGAAGVSASRRIKGIVLHDILAQVRVKADLDAAVKRAVVAGVLSWDESEEVRQVLHERICSVESEGWFPEDASSVLNEVEMIDKDGSVYRPDRVLRIGRSVKIVDYKFGAHYGIYEEKLSKYADIWRDMGYDVESACLWYVTTGDIVRIS